MTASQIDFAIEQGTTLAYVFQVLNKDLTTGYTWSAKGRYNHGVTTTVFTTSGTANAAISAAKSGNHTHATLAMTAAQTAALDAPGYGVYDIEYTETATGTVTRAFEGTFYITPEVTR